MDPNKLEQLETIRKFLEKDDIPGLNRFIEKINSLVKKDEDFQDIFAEVKDKNYEQALFLAEDIIYEIKDADMHGDFEEVEDLEMEDFNQDDDFLIEGEENFEDINVDSFDDLSYLDEKDEDDNF
jgi:hypothetical protein